MKIKHTYKMHQVSVQITVNFEANYEKISVHTSKNML